MSSAPWQRTQCASRIAATSFVYVGFAGTSGAQPPLAAASAMASGMADSTFDITSSQIVVKLRHEQRPRRLPADGLILPEQHDLRVRVREDVDLEVVAVTRGPADA